MSEPLFLLLALASVIVLGIGAQWLAWRLGVASILLLLVAGFLAGPVSGLVFGRPLVDPDELLGDLLAPFVSIAVALILYEGGLSLRLAELREARAAVWRLVTFGAAITWALTALAAWLVLDLSPAMAILLGAVLVVTGPTVIVPLLIHIRPSGRIGAILKWEGIVIDPIGAMLAVLVFEAILLPSLGEAAPHVAVTLIKTIVIGGSFGFVAGMALALVLRWFWVPDYLENAVSIMFVVGAYTAAHWLQPESGLLAAVVMGITLANQRLVDVRHIVEFKENLRVLLISSLFVLLAARLLIADLTAIGWSGLVFLGLIVVVVRPASAFLCTLGSGLSGREVAFLSVMGPRGIVAAAVASIFALHLGAEGYAEAGVLVPLTFLVIIGTVSISSITAPYLAHRLGLADPKPQGVLLVGAHTWGRMLAAAINEQGFRALLVDTNRADIAAARMAGLETYSESILAEHLLDEIDLGGLGRLMAATPNDMVNILTVHRFLRVFGRSEVYQVSPRQKMADDAHRHLHGRWLFDEDLSHNELARRVARGAIVKPTTLSAEFTYESFREHYGDTAVILFVVTASRRLNVITAEQPVDPKAGDTLVCLVEEGDEN
ncbi:MAG: cation:proton antiporter [Planctomycetota bacterium]